MTRFVFCFAVLFLALSVWASAQVNGGQSAYRFLTLPLSARLSALGGYQVAYAGNDVALGAQNPALYNADMHRQAQFNHDIYFAGINHGSALYAHHFDSLATTFAAGIQYVSYGQFDLTDETGAQNGTFSGGEYALTLGAARKYAFFTYGVNLKLIGSHLESYNSFGAAIDAGLAYQHPKQPISVGLTLKNLGAQLLTYNGVQENLPFDIQVGYSQKLLYLPFRFSIIAHHLYRWDIRYNDPALQQTNNLFTNQPDANKSYFADKLARHLIFNGEFTIGKALLLGFGYNHLRRQELGISARRTLSGFSFGASIRLKRFAFSYAKAIYHAAGGNNHIGINLNLNL
ncbi:MAG TPA: type IX secretion system protein PorQ, partial [Chitinophagales bacterium]|nr:type IX secretion system protein PorQ [Chitinophagales bacterium]